MFIRFVFKILKSIQENLIRIYLLKNLYLSRLSFFYSEEYLINLLIAYIRIIVLFRFFIFFHEGTASIIM